MDNNVLYHYLQDIPPERSVDNSAFGLSTIRWSASQDSYNCYRLKTSPFIIRLKMTRADGDLLLPSDLIAPNMYLADCLWKSHRTFLNGVEVSSIQSEVAQTAALKRRLFSTSTEDKAWCEDFMLSQPNFHERQNVIVGAGARNDYHVIGSSALGASIGRGVPIDLLAGASVEIPAAALTNVQFTAVTGYKGRDIFSVGEQIYVLDGGGPNLETRTIGAITQVSDTAFTLVLTAAATTAINNGAPAALTDEILKKEHAVYAFQRHQASKEIELIWTPKESLWEIDSFITGDIRIELQPYNSPNQLNLAIMESIGNASKAYTDVTFEIVSIRWALDVGVLSSPWSGSIQLSLNEANLQMQHLTTASSADKMFNGLPTNTYALTLAFQNGNVLSDTRYSQTKFKIANDQDLRLAKYSIKFRGVTLPNPEAAPDYKDVDGQRDWILFQYYQSLLYSGQLLHMDNSEPFHEWKQRGPYYHHSWPLQGGADTTAIVNTQFAFSDADVIINHAPNIMLWSHYYRTLTLNVSGGKLTSLSLN